MNKTKKTTLFTGIALAVLLLAGFAGPLYFAGQVSATYPHLGDYHYTMSARQLQAELHRVLRAESGFTCTVTDTTGTGAGRAYYMTVHQSLGDTSRAYHLVYSDHHDEGCTLGLVSVVDKTDRSVTCHDIKKNSARQVALFEKQLLARLNK